jgi:sec-independent protein translocase protein TatA
MTDKMATAMMISINVNARRRCIDEVTLPARNHKTPGQGSGLDKWPSQIALQVGPRGLNVASTMSAIASLTNLFSGGDLLIILLVILLLFGAKKLPELARGMGQAIKEFQKAKDEFTDELHKAGDAPKSNLPPVSTVARTDAPQAARPDPNQAAAPGDQTKPV